MIVETAAAFRDAWNADHTPADRPATMRAALLVSPHGFGVSSISAEDNHYIDVSAQVDLERAHVQHCDLAARLGGVGLPVLTVPGLAGLDDAIYPNNVYGTIPGRFIVGSMRHPHRRLEGQREDIRRLFTETFGYQLCDISEGHGIAELTGPLVINRARGIGFCGMTQRVDDAGVAAMDDAFDLRVMYRFDLDPSEYHTNLVLAILAGRACVIHPPSFRNPDDAAAIMAAYPERTLVLTDDEKEAFAGNCMSVTPTDVFFSDTAHRVLRPQSIGKLQDWGFTVHSIVVDELEKGGGSLRCMIAEIY